MQEGDSLSLRADARFVVDELDAGTAAPIESRVEIVNRKANVMNSRSALRHEACDRGRRIAGLEQLDERVAGGESRDPRAISVRQRHLRETEDLAKEWHASGKGFYGDPNV